MRVLFLDIDGVLNSKIWLLGPGRELNPDNRIDPEKVARLNRIIEATGCKVVVSSSWRLAYKQISPLEALLVRHGITATIVGMTPCLWEENRTANRGDEIQAWLDSNQGEPVEGFVILDDEADMGRLWPRLVQTTFKAGLQDSHVDQAIALFNKLPFGSQ